MITEKRLITRREAAAYVGLSVSSFDDWVKRRRLPGPLFGGRRWDRKAIDQALDRASGLDSVSPFAEWRRGREGEDAGRKYGSQA